MRCLICKNIHSSLILIYTQQILPPKQKQMNSLPAVQLLGSPWGRQAGEMPPYQDQRQVPPNLAGQGIPPPYILVHPTYQLLLKLLHVPTAGIAAKTRGVTLAPQHQVSILAHNIYPKVAGAKKPLSFFGKLDKSLRRTVKATAGHPQEQNTASHV